MQFGKVLTFYEKYFYQTAKPLFMKSYLKIENKVSAGYFYLSVLLVAYVFWRCVSVSFTHDESLSYTIITGNNAQAYTANNHWLNTILMYVSSRIFGYSEWALRLPNLIALVFYLFFVYRIFKQFCVNEWTLLLAVPLLVLNPFLIDFFGLARGYGLGVSFFTASVYYGMMYFQKKTSARYLVFFILCSIACIYSNYAFITAVLALHVALLVFFFRRHLDNWKQILLFYGIEVLLLIPALLNILYLQKMKELYAGGDTGVFHDSIQTVLSYSFINSSYGLGEKMEWGLIVLAIIGFLLYYSKPFNLTKLWIVLLIFIPFVMHLTLNMGYAKDRAAQYWIVGWGLFVLFLTDVLLEKKPVDLFQKVTKTASLGWIALIQVVALFNFIASVNVSHSIIWKYDSDVKNAITLLEQNANKEKINSTGINWALEPALNYYIETRNLKWIRPVTRDGVSGKYDFYLFFEEDISSLDASPKETLHFYTESGMYVSRSKLN